MVFSNPCMALNAGHKSFKKGICHRRKVSHFNKTEFKHERIEHSCKCPFVFKPVCGDGITYSNRCNALCAKSKNIKSGRCVDHTCLTGK